MLRLFLPFLNSTTLSNSLNVNTCFYVWGHFLCSRHGTWPFVYIDSFSPHKCPWVTFSWLSKEGNGTSHQASEQSEGSQP